MLTFTKRKHRRGQNLARFSVLVMAATLALSACHGTEDTKIAKNAVDEFHSRLNAEQYHEIYVQTTDDFKKYTSEPNLTELLKGIHHKLGNVQTAKNTAIQFSHTSWGVFVNANYDTTFEKSQAQERFTILLSSKNSMLVSYHITSPELVSR